MKSLTVRKRSSSGKRKEDSAGKCSSRAEARWQSLRDLSLEENRRIEETSKRVKHASEQHKDSQKIDCAQICENADLLILIEPANIQKKEN